MKKGLGTGLLILTGLLLACALGFGQIIENPVKPLAANAGRIVTLKEELRIEDTGEGYFFKNPGPIRVSPRGDIFFKDGQEQALLFDPKGRFVRNFYKKGQGPGELSTILDTWASPDRIYLNGYPPKILVYDYEGNLVQELPLRGELLGGRFILAEPEDLLMYATGRPDPSGGTGFRDLPWDIVEIAPDGSPLKTIASFPVPSFLQVEEGGTISVRAWNVLQVVAFDSGSLFLNSSPEYMIENFNRDKKAVVLRFRRPYARQKRTGGGGFSTSSGGGPAAPEFLPDIYALHLVDGRLWVQTSTVTEEKGILFDVFDIKGRYLDNFYVRSLKKTPDGQPARSLMTIAGGCAYFSEETAEGLIVIRKCRLVGF
jgi:hypothetical protein